MRPCSLREGSRRVKMQEKERFLIMACIESHPYRGKGVAVVDDVDVCVCRRVKKDISRLTERMGEG